MCNAKRKIKIALYKLHYIVNNNMKSNITLKGMTKNTSL